MSFWRGIVGGKEVSEAPCSHNFADFFSSWRRERVKSANADEFFLPKNRTFNKDVPAHKIKCWDTHT